MFEFEQCDHTIPSGQRHPALDPKIQEEFGPDRIRSHSVMSWGEHCSECAFPSCYQTCSFYKARPDGAAAASTSEFTARRILVSGVGRDSRPTGICRVAASHTRALLSNRVASRVLLAIGSWQYELFRTLLGPYAPQIKFLVTNIKNNSISRNLWYVATLPRLAKAHGTGLVHLSYPAPAFQRAFSSPVVLTLHRSLSLRHTGEFRFPPLLCESGDSSAMSFFRRWDCMRLRWHEQDCHHVQSEIG